MNRKSDGPPQVSVWTLLSSSLVCLGIGLIVIFGPSCFGGYNGNRLPVIFAFAGGLLSLAWLHGRIHIQLSRQYSLSRTEWFVFFCLSIACAVPVGGFSTVYWVIYSSIKPDLTLPPPGIGGVMLLVVGAFVPTFLLLYGLLLKMVMGGLRTRLSRHLLSLVLLTGLIGLGAYLRHDVDPVPNMFSITQFPVPKKDAAESYRLLLTYHVGGTKVLGDPSRIPQCSGDYLTNSIAYSEKMESVWSEIADARVLMARLDAFDSIADLSNPTLTEPRMSFVAYRAIAQSYYAYSLLKCQEGKPLDSAKYLAQLHAVARKALPYSRTLLRKAILVAVLRSDMNMAHFLLSDEHFDDHAVQILESIFTPISGGDLSMRLPMIVDYMKFRELSENTELTHMPDKVSFIEDDCCALPLALLGSVPDWLAPLIYNPHRTAQSASDFYLPIIDSASTFPFVWPSSVETYFHDKIGVPPIKNLVGRLLIVSEMPEYKHEILTMNTTKVASDLLALEMAQRLGESLTLSDPWTGEPYRKDPTNGTFSSSGPDKLPGTADDIRLPLDNWP